MKTFYIARFFLLTAFFAFNIVSCTKNELTTVSGSSSLIPTVSITAITQITSFTTIVDGDISGDGGSAVTVFSPLCEGLTSQ